MVFTWSTQILLQCNNKQLRNSPSSNCGKLSWNSKHHPHSVRMDNQNGVRLQWALNISTSQRLLASTYGPGPYSHGPYPGPYVPEPLLISKSTYAPEALFECTLTM